MKSILIRDTTRQEREEIVRQSLSWCGGGCENCSSCWLGGGKAEDIYQPYMMERRRSRRSTGIPGKLPARYCLRDIPARTAAVSARSETETDLINA